MSAVQSADLKVVLDTNIYFSAFTNAQGVPFRIWQQAVKKRYTLLVSPAIIREFADVLRTCLGWPESQVLTHLKLIVKTAQVVAPTTVLEAIHADPDDNRILECAVEGKAHLIVSGDRHLTRLKNFQGIGIVRPADFLRTLGV